MSRGPLLWAIGGLVVCLNLAAAADTYSQTRKTGQPGQRTSSRVVESGYLIWNGQTLTPPYLITATSDGVEINGVEVVWENIKPAPFPATGRSGRLKSIGNDAVDSSLAERPRFAKRHRLKRLADPNVDSRLNAIRSSTDSDLPTIEVAHLSEPPERFFFVGGERPVRQAAFVDALSASLTNDNLIVHLSDEPLLVAETPHDVDTILAALLPDLVGDVPIQSDWSITEAVYDANNPDAWRAWLTGFQPPSPFIERVDTHFRAVEELISEAQSARSAVIRVDWIAYPLTVLGMLLSVGALGHLLRSVPDRVEAETEMSSTRLERATITAVLLIAGLSGLDLTWTIMSAQAGTMRELNPLGAQLVHDPVTLSVFKVSATLVGCGLLFRLRKHRKVADASWWMCLVMTVVTFRWVMFNSMFA